MSSPEPRKDPRFRPYRAASIGIYIAVVSIFSLATVVSVGRSVAAMTPGTLPPAAETLSFRECLDSAQLLWNELEERREHLARVGPARKVDQEWMGFRTGWLAKLRVSESQCALESRDRGGLRTVFKRLERVQDAYTIHAVQYAGEVGADVESLDHAFKDARRSPSAGKL